MLGPCRAWASGKGCNSVAEPITCAPQLSCEGSPITGSELRRSLPAELLPTGAGMVVCPGDCRGGPHISHRSATRTAIKPSRLPHVSFSATRPGVQHCLPCFVASEVCQQLLRLTFDPPHQLMLRCLFCCLVGAGSTRHGRTTAPSLLPASLAAAVAAASAAASQSRGPTCAQKQCCRCPQAHSGVCSGDERIGAAAAAGRLMQCVCLQRCRQLGTGDTIAAAQCMPSSVTQVCQRAYILVDVFHRLLPSPFRHLASFPA